MVSRHTEVSIIAKLNEIPSFATEQDEAEYWRTHSLSDELLDQMAPVDTDVLPPPRLRTRPIAVRFDQDIVRRLKALASVKRKGYQTLLKEFVVERLYEEEKREGLVGGTPPDAPDRSPLPL
jgi:hypothetical protein